MLNYLKIRKLSPAGALVFSLTLIFSGILLPRNLLLYAVLISWVMLWYFDFGTLKLFRNGLLAIWAISSLLLLPLLIGGNGIPLAPGMEYSRDTMFIMLRALARGCLVLAGMNFFRRQVPFSYFRKILKRRFTGGQFSLLMPLALQILPAIIENSQNIYKIWKIRGGWRRNRLRNLLTLGTSLQVQWIREAEELAISLALEEKKPCNPPITNE